LIQNETADHRANEILPKLKERKRTYAQEVGMKLEVGKSYRTRGGDVVKITKFDNHETWPFENEAGYSYTEDGYVWESSNTCKDDLVTEVEDSDDLVDLLFSNGPDPMQTCLTALTQMTERERKAALAYFAERWA
jgi:hypothetical protein